MDLAQGGFVCGLCVIGFCARDFMQEILCEGALVFGVWLAWLLVRLGVCF